MDEARRAWGQSPAASPGGEAPVPSVLTARGRGAVPTVHSRGREAEQSHAKSQRGTARGAFVTGLVPCPTAGVRRALRLRTGRSQHKAEAPVVVLWEVWTGGGHVSHPTAAQVTVGRSQARARADFAGSCPQERHFPQPRAGSSRPRRMPGVPLLD